MATANIVVVCTGNVRRSPVIAALLRSGTESIGGLEGHGVTVRSAGTRAVIGHGLDSTVAAGLRDLGVPEPAHSARQLLTADIEEADLVLAADRTHRSEVTRLVPAAVRRTFTLLELAALAVEVDRMALGEAESDVAVRLRRLVHLAPAARAARVLRRRTADDLADLHRPTRRAARRLVKEIAGPVESILRIVEPETGLSPVWSRPPAIDGDRRTESSMTVVARSAVHAS